MWIYQQAGTENPLPPQSAELALLPEKTTEEVQTTASLPENTPAATAAAASAVQRPRPAGQRASRDCWLLAAAFLLGGAAAGILQAVCDTKQLELLQYYLHVWQGLFSTADLQHTTRLFSAEYVTLGALVSALLLLGLSALGPTLIFLLMMLYGLGSGLLLVQLAAAGGWKVLLAALLLTGLPGAAASGCLCLFGASALQVSSRLHAYSFRRSGGQARPGVRVLLGQYVLTMVVLLPLCGAATALSFLGSRF